MMSPAWRHHPRYKRVWARFNTRVRYRFRDEIRDIRRRLKWVTAAYRLATSCAARHRYRLRQRMLRLELTGFYRVAAEEGRREAYRSYVTDAPYCQAVLRYWSWRSI